MSLFTNIKNLRAEAFKAGDKFLHSVLTNVYSDASPVGAEAAAQAAAGTTPEDSSVVAIVKKHLKGVVETLEAYAKSEIHPDFIALKQREKDILESLLPKQLSADELKSVLASVVPASLKDWMSHLKSNFAGLYDGKVAKQVFETEQAAKQDIAPLPNPTPVVETAAAPADTGQAPVASPVVSDTPAIASGEAGNVDGSAPGVVQSDPNSPAAEPATK